MPISSDDTKQVQALAMPKLVYQTVSSYSGGFYGAIWKYAFVILVAAPLFAATDFVEMRLVLEWRRWLTSTLMAGYFANRTFFKLHHQLGLLDNPDQVRHELSFSSTWPLGEEDFLERTLTGAVFCAENVR